VNQRKSILSSRRERVAKGNGNPPPVSDTVTITINCGVGGATVYLDDKRPVGTTLTANEQGTAIFYNVSKYLRNTYVKCTATGYKELIYNTILSGHDETIMLKMEKIGIESGPLFRTGQYLYRADSTIFDYRGATLFLVPTRYFRGENIQPQIDWMNKHGFNVARMFVAGVNWAGWNDPIYNNPQYQDKLASLLSRFNDSGIRVECTVVTYQGDINVWRKVVQEVYDVIRTHRMNIVEIMNEPAAIWTNQAALQIAQGLNPYGAMVAYGIQPPCNISDVKDYMTVHVPRDERFFRNSKVCYEIRVGIDSPAFNCPVVSDEPVGVIDPSQYPNYHQSGIFWVDQYGRGVRTTDIRSLAFDASIGRLLNCGWTYHSQAGLEGRIPTDKEPIQEQAAVMISEVNKFIPFNAQRGTYTRPGLGDFPVAFNGTEADHPYAMILGNDAWLTMTKCAPNWKPTPVNGWKVKEIDSKLNWLVHLVK
jgi:hypothetical protein